MIRASLVVLVVAAAAVAILALTGDAGRASVVWLGWRADMTASAAALIVMFASLAFTVGWRTLLWVLAAPRRAERTRAESRRRQANETLTAASWRRRPATAPKPAAWPRRRPGSPTKPPGSSGSWPPRPPKPRATSSRPRPPTPPCWGFRRCAWPATRA